MSKKKNPIFGDEADDLFAEAKKEAEQIKMQKLIPVKKAEQKLQEMDKLFDVVE
jgi:hypothetical protein